MQQTPPRFWHGLVPRNGLLEQNPPRQRGREDVGIALARTRTKVYPIELKISVIDMYGKRFTGEAKLET